jgi:hypothetical protein
MFKQRLLAGLAAGSLIVGFTSTVANAIDVEMGGSITAQSALTAGTITDLDFGVVEYAATHSGTIQLGTNGAITFDTPVGLTAGGGTPNAGSVTISGDTGATVDVSCDTSATLDDGAAGAALTLSGIEVTAGAGAAYDGAGTFDCAGVATASIDGATLTGGSITLLVGGAIDLGGLDASGTYNSANGTTFTLRVVYE